MPKPQSGSYTLFTWSGGPRSSGVSFFCFVSPRAWKQKKLTPLDRGPPLHVNRPLMKNLPWHAIRWLSNQTTVTPLKFLIIIHNYANVWTINHSKSLPGFRVVTSLDGIIQTFNRAEKRTRSNRLKSRLLFGEFRFSKKSFNVLISSFTIFNGFVATLALRRTDVCHGNFVISLVKL